MMSRPIAEHPDVRFERLADRIEVDLEAGLAAEFGRWEGGWTSDEGAAVVRSGRFCGQWRWASEVEQWLLNAEIYVPEVLQPEGAASGGREVSWYVVKGDGPAAGPSNLDFVRRRHDMYVLHQGLHS